MSRGLLGADAPLTATTGPGLPLIDADRLRRQTGSTAPVPEPTLWETIGANFRLSRDDQSGHQEEEETQAYAPIVQELSRRTGRPWSYYVSTNRGTTSGKAVWDDVATVRAREPGAFADLPGTRDEFDRQWRAGYAQRRAADQQTSDRGGWGGFLIGSVGGALTDPVNIGTMWVGGGAARTAGQAALREAGVNAGAEMLQQPLIAAERAKRGETLSAGEAAANVGLAGVIGGGVGAVAHGAGKRLERWQRLTADSELADAVDAAVPPALQDAETRAAVATIRRDDRIGRTSPFTPGAGDAQHGARLDAATTALETGRLPPQRPVSRAAAAAREAGDSWEQVKSLIRRRESGGNDAARNPLSTAAGRYQMIDGTWLRVMRQLGETGTDAAVLSKKGNIVLQERAMDRLGQDYKAALDRIGAPTTAGNLYLMHFAGTGGGMRILRAAPDRAIETILGARAVAANPFLRGKTAEDVVEWAHRGMGDRTPSGAVVARDQFADDAAGDAEWADAQRAVALEEAQIAAERAEARAPSAFETDMPIVRTDADDDIPFDLDDPRAIPAGTRGNPFDDVMDGDVLPMSMREEWQASVARLRAAQGGEAPRALYHPETGAIDVKWGQAGDAANGYRGGYGLAHILAKHPEMEAQLADLPQLIEGMTVKQQRAERLVLESADHEAAVALTWHGADQRWLLTAYEKGKTPDGPTSVRGPMGGGSDSSRPGAMNPLADFGGEVELPARVADAIVAREGDILTLRDPDGYTFEWNPRSEMQRTGNGWRRLRADQIDNGIADQLRAAEDAPDPWAAMGRVETAPRLNGYDEIDSLEAGRLDDSMAHDAAMLLEEEPDLILQPADDDGRAQITLAEAIDDADGDMAAVTAARACMVPPGGEA